jgi:hypothetical protein
MKRLLLLTALLFVVAGCQTGSGDGGGGGTVDEDPIQWDRNPNTVVFRAEVLGGEFADAFFARNEVPFCTIYGDNRIVWTVTAAGTDQQVLFDRLTDEQMRAFIGSLTIDDRIYTYDAQADQQLPSQVAPAYEKLTLFVNGTEHVTDSFSTWPPNYFNTVLQKCRSVSQAPTEFVPDAAWVSAQVADFASGVPSVTWDGIAANLDLKPLAESSERRWVTGRYVGVLWRVIRINSLDMHFTQPEGDTYLVAVEVPGVNPSAPPAPSN